MAKTKGIKTVKKPTKRQVKKSDVVEPFKYVAEREFDQGFGSLPFRPIGSGAETIGRLQEQVRTLKEQFEIAKREKAIVNEPITREIGVGPAETIKYAKSLGFENPIQKSSATQAEFVEEAPAYKTTTRYQTKGFIINEPPEFPKVQGGISREIGNPISNISKQPIEVSGSVAGRNLQTQILEEAKRENVDYRGFGMEL